MHVITDAGRTIDATEYMPAATIGELATAVATQYHGELDDADARTWALKVDGVVMHPDLDPAVIALHGDATIELVDVASYDWPVIDFGEPPEMLGSLAGNEAKIDLEALAGLTAEELTELEELTDDEREELAALVDEVGA